MFSCRRKSSSCQRNTKPDSDWFLTCNSCYNPDETVLCCGMSCQRLTCLTWFSAIFYHIKPTHLLRILLNQPKTTNWICLLHWYSEPEIIRLQYGEVGNIFKLQYGCANVNRKAQKINICLPPASTALSSKSMKFCCKLTCRTETLQRNV